MENYTLAVLKADKNNISEGFQKAVAFLEKDEKNCLNAFYANDYKFIKKNNPDLFEKVKAFVEAERLQPLGAWWDNDEDGKISDEKLARNVLYSQKFMMKNFGKILRTGYGKKIANPLSAEILFGARMNAYVEENSDMDFDLYWIDSRNTYRVMGAKACALNIKSIDEISADDNTVTFDKYFSEVYNTLDDIDVSSEIDYSMSLAENEIEKLLLSCETLDTVNVIKNNAESKIKEINKAWKAYLAGCPSALEKAEAIAIELKDITAEPQEIFETTSNTVELVTIKKCCKKCDDILIRIRQTENVSEKIVVKSKLLDVCFWVDIEPYEIRSFIINANGTPQESNFIENIDL